MEKGGDEWRGEPSEALAPVLVRRHRLWPTVSAVACATEDGKEGSRLWRVSPSLSGCPARERGEASLVFVGQALAGLDDHSVIQCPGGIISVGDTKFEVREKCGMPTSVEGNGHIWIYDYGSTEFVRYITFVEDRVERIQSGNYGK